MKVLLINTSDHTGGAAIAALRLLQALRHAGMDAKLLCRDRTLPATMTEVISLKPSWRNRLRFLLERLEIFLRNGLSREGLFSVDTARLGYDVTQLPAFREADVIHLHWTNQGMLSLSDLRRILTSGKRVVWTMHDMWPFTGICHQADACTAWLHGCGHCPRLRHPGEGDLSATTYRRKARTYATGSMTLVGCSRWLAGLAARAPLLQGQRIADIPNPIDTDYYAPAGSEGQHNRATLRRTLGLPPDKRLLLFAAYKVTDPDKGIDYLLESLTILMQTQPALCRDLGIILAGHEAETLRHAFPIEALPVGYVSDEGRMRALYQSADLVLMPTLMDNLPNTIAEAMACGVPCVAFGVGGVPQMVDTDVNGYLARPRDPADFAHGIARLLTSPGYATFCANARAKAVKAYSGRSVARRYIELYQAE